MNDQIAGQPQVAVISAVQSPKISILLPTFNGARFLPEQIDSVLAQTFCDFELLIYDDGSSDQTWNIVCAYADKDLRISAWPGDKNAGQGAALQFLLGKATAPMIAFCDQDDIWHLDKLQLLLAHIGSADLAYGTSDIIDQLGEDLGANIFYFCGRPILGVDPVRFLIRNTVSAHAMLVRRDIVTEDHFCQPMPFDWLIATAAAASQGIIYVREARTRHRMHGNNQMNAFGKLPPKQRGPTRERQLQNLLCVIEAVMSSPNTKPEMKVLFAKLRRSTERLQCDGRFNLFNRQVIREIEKLGAISPDTKDLYKLTKLYRRLSRGHLHPATWRNVIRNRARWAALKR